jgi:hypothetical protein
MKWEYEARSWEFRDPEQDPWPGRDRYNEALGEQARAETARRTASRGRVTFASLAGIPESAITGVSHETAVTGQEGQQLAADYVGWRLRSEVEFLNEWGQAGFELVSITRIEQWEQRSRDHVTFYAFPTVLVHAYFKRPMDADAPEPPRRKIGFQPIGATRRIGAPGSGREGPSANGT